MSSSALLPDARRAAAAGLLAACVVTAPALAQRSGSHVRPAAAGLRAVTLDADHDGRLDALSVSPGSRVGRLAPSAIRVRGHVVRRLSRTRGHLVVRLRETNADTGARPRLRVRLHGRWHSVAVHDGAAPVLLSVIRDERRHRVVMRFSEGVRAPALSARAFVPRSRGWTFLGLGGATIAPTTVSGLGTPVITATVPVSAPAPTSVVVNHGALGDRSGNLVSQLRRSVASPSMSGWHVLHNPIDPAQQTSLAFCDRSHWLQPWRGYLDTRPTSALLDATGVNMNVGPAQFADTARLLADRGFHRARIEIGWDQMSYDRPDQLRDPAGLLARIQILKQYGIRPLILLNAHHGVPGPAAFFDLRLTQDAPAGARQVQIDPALVSSIVPGRTGIANLTDYKADEVIFTAVTPGGLATLSKPLPRALSAGTYRGSTLRFEPFARPSRGDGSPNPRFEQTLSGWLQYVSAVTHTVRDALGSDSFDVEVWNELNFGSDFLDAGRYYDPLPAELGGQGDTNRQLLGRTVSWLRNPANGVSRVGIGDGFASQTPFAAGSTEPTGVTAMSKHPYSGARQVFGANTGASSCRPVNALGQREGTAAGGDWQDAFTPSYVDYFPEYYLTALQTEHLIRDVSPFTTDLYGTTHGRATGPGVWVTETNMDPAQAGLTGAPKSRMQAKSTLRTLVSFVSKGVSVIDFYAATGDQFGLIDPAFFRNTSDMTAGGPTLNAVSRLMGTMGTSQITVPRALSLLSVADRHDHKQFDGDGTAAHPALYNRDVVAVLPFQSSDRRFVVPAYVMTRDVAQDLAPETYRLEIGGVSGYTARVSASDPLTGTTTAATIISRTRSSITIQTDLTDSPRLLEISD